MDRVDGELATPVWVAGGGVGDVEEVIWAEASAFGSWNVRQKCPANMFGGNFHNVIT